MIEPDGTVHRGSRAVLFANGQCGWWLLPAVFWSPPMKWCADLGYYVLANNRIFFSRFVYTKGKGQHVEVAAAPPDAE